MPITEHAKKRRRDYLGSSDAAAILGRDPWRTATDVYFEKTVDLQENSTNVAMETGNRLEHAIIDYAADRLGKTVRKNQFRVADNGIMAANCDAVVVDCPEIVEAKFSTKADEWGDDGSDSVPTHVALQTQHQLAVTGAERAWVPVLLLSFRPEWRLLMVPRCQEIIDILTEAELAFWRNHVEPRVPPSNDPPPLDILKRLIREPASIKTLTDEEAIAATQAWTARELANEVKKDAEAKYNEATSRCLQYLDNCEAALLPDGSELRYLDESGGWFLEGDNLKALKIDSPEIFQKYAHERRRRMLRLKKPPKKKG